MGMEAEVEGVCMGAEIRGVCMGAKIRGVCIEEFPNRREEDCVEERKRNKKK